jgi:hypothetical protein
MNLRVKLATVVLMSLVILGAGQRAYALPILNPTNGHYYEFIEVGPGLTWEQALAAADAATFDPGTGLLDGHLVTITSAAEHAFVAGLAPFGATASAENGFWLAGSDTDVEGTWVWQAGPETGEIFYFHPTLTSLGYTNWAPGEPNDVDPGEDYLEMFTYWADGRWNDLFNPGPNITPYNYVVEYSVAAVPDSPVPAVTLLLAFAGLAILYRGLN